MAQLMFESFPLAVMNLLLILDVFEMPEMQENKVTIVVSFSSTILKVIKELSVLYFSSNYLNEHFLIYGLTQMKARFGWIPY